MRRMPAICSGPARGREHHHQLLREIGATDAAHLVGARLGQTVLVAGVRASTQTPPIASGRRVIFVTLEDGSGMVDLAFFEDPEAVLQFLGAGGSPPADSGQLQWTIRMETGAELQPYADLRPAGGRSANLKALGYAGPGFSGLRCVS